MQPASVLLAAAAVRLIAEEVEEVFPELVAYGRDGEPETVRYHLLPALLLNELQRQEAKLAAQEEQIRGLTRQVEELWALVGQRAKADDK